MKLWNSEPVCITYSLYNYLYIYQVSIMYPMFFKKKYLCIYMGASGSLLRDLCCLFGILTLRRTDSLAVVSASVVVVQELQNTRASVVVALGLSDCAGRALECLGSVRSVCRLSCSVA